MKGIDLIITSKDDKVARVHFNGWSWELIDGDLLGKNKVFAESLRSDHVAPFLAGKGYINADDLRYFELIMRDIDRVVPIDTSFDD